MIERKILADLLTWKVATNRKVLLLRGARQIGKTFTARQLAATFSTCLEVNFLETPEVARFFQGGSLDPVSILRNLEAYFEVKLPIGEGLLFFDEIQACPEAITALRFFYEKIPELHVIATGSLLEFALAEIPSFGVGRIDSLFMYPLSIEEFFKANGQGALLQAIQLATLNKSVDSVLHNKACETVRIYSMIGGLPAVVQTYLESKDINSSLTLLDSLLLAYEDDFTKYKTRISPLKLRQTLTSCATQAGGKFVYSHIKPGSSVSGYDQAVELLRLAGMIYVVSRTSANGIPLGAESDPKSFKAIPFDIGIYNRLLGLKFSDRILLEDTAFVHEGASAEVLCGLELVASTPSRLRPELHYWSREKQSSNAEVDYVVQQGMRVVPVEVKAGHKGRMQSMFVFMNEKQCGRGVRTSLENLSSFATPSGGGVIEVVPLYLVGRWLGDRA
jgi:predicted AAA+ superfamily ATPase